MNMASAMKAVGVTMGGESRSTGSSRQRDDV